MKNGCFNSTVKSGRENNFVILRGSEKVLKLQSLVKGATSRSFEFFASSKIVVNWKKTFSIIVCQSRQTPRGKNKPKGNNDG